ncbi:hypothetical protein [Gorillibacterium massiliense]|uniref:hypothetical protein n=1 Tax=Gorillibacterium massiliense TaxID=1280390 RepID=UPI0012DD235A|nr:hypothetical protein [Gorillibacterium massiliense]
MRKSALAVGLLVVLCLFTACEKESDDPRAAGTSAKVTMTATPTPGASVSAIGASSSPNPTSTPNLSFRDSITELGIYQEDPDKGGGREIVSFMPSVLPSSPVSYAYHLDKLYGFITFKELPESKIAELLKDIRADQGTFEIRMENPEVLTLTPRYKWTLTGLDRKATLTFGDLPSIAVKRMEPMTFTVDGFMVPDYIPSFGAKILKQGEGSQTAVIRFSEPVDTKNVEIKPGGEWLDSRRLKVTLDPPYSQPTFEIHNLFGISGNSLARGKDLYLSLDVVEPAVWYDSTSGKKAGWSRFDPFYDDVIFAPDGNSYIGLVNTNEEVVDAPGGIYALFLERKNQETKLLSNGTYYTFTDGTIIQWLDNERFMTKDLQGAYVYDTVTDKRQNVRILTAKEKDEPKWISGYSYDPQSNRTYLTLTRYDRKNDSFFPVDLEIYEGAGERLLEKKENLTVTYQDYKYHAMVIRPLFHTLGTFWNGSEDEKWTVTWQKSNGSVQTVKGRGVTADEKGLYLMRQVGKEQMTVEYAYWVPGRKPKLLPKVNDSDWGNVQPFGDRLISNNYREEGSSLLIFDKASWSWKPAPIELQNSWAPYQVESSYYRASVVTK